jgi:glycosyltransferase involved in cell wall biosynthesis
MLAGDHAGIVCEGHPREIADAIFKAASTRAELRSMATRGQALAASKTWERTASLLLGEYERKLKGKAG